MCDEDAFAIVAVSTIAIVGDDKVDIVLVGQSFDDIVFVPGMPNHVRHLYGYG